MLSAESKIGTAMDSSIIFNGISKLEILVNEIASPSVTVF